MFVIDHDPLRRIFTDKDAACRAAQVLSDIVYAEVEILVLDGFGPNHHEAIITVEPTNLDERGWWPGETAYHQTEWWRV